MIRSVIGIFILVIIFSSFGCEKKANNPLTRAERKLVDSLYRLEIDSLRTNLDQWCKEKYDSIYQEAVDSIMDLRINEIFLIRNEE